MKEGKIFNAKYCQSKHVSAVPQAEARVEQLLNKKYTTTEEYKMLNDIEILAECTPAKEGENSQWSSIVNSAE
jgi:hypothetical protein